jgi:hypothetical protein
MTTSRRWTAREIARTMAAGTKSTARNSGGSWICRCPAHNDIGESLSCRDQTHRDGNPVVLFNCFAGCDFVSIVRSLRGYGIDIPPSKPRRKDWKAPPPPEKPVPIVEPVKEYRYAPERAGEKPFAKEMLKGKIAESITDIYDWYDDEGRLVFHTVRVVEYGVKKVMPVTPCTDLKTGQMVWRMQGPEGPRPLYNTQNDTGQPVILAVEGEKTAKAAIAIFGRQNVWVTTTHGGSKSAAYADWKRVSGRKVVIAHDIDQAGLAYAAVVAENSRLAGAASLHLWTIPTSHIVRKGRIVARDHAAKKGYDLADAREDGWTLGHLIARQTPWHGPEITPIP